MRRRNAGRILITGSIAGFIPGSFQAVYNDTKAFLDSFSFALREELRGSKVTVTCLMPGQRIPNSSIGLTCWTLVWALQRKDDPADVAEAGFKAIMNGERDVVSGWKNKIQSSIANITPAPILAKITSQNC